MAWPADAQQPLRWGGDAEGGAPFVEADPRDAQKVVGFDVEVAELIARELGRLPQFVQVAYASLDQSAMRGDFDIGLSGIEDTPARRAAVAASIPYYRFREVLTVREADRNRYRTLEDLKGRRVATLGGTIAYDILLEAQRTHGIVPVSYDDDVHPYGDTLVGRVDAVLLDNVLAARSMSRMSGLYTQPTAVAIGHYIIITAPERTELRDSIDAILRRAMADGRLEAIFRKWQSWNDDQPQLYAEVAKQNTQDREQSPSSSLTPSSAVTPQPSALELTSRYLPALLRAAVITLVLSCLAMALAVALGVAIAVGRIYGDPLTRATLTFYVEVMRGTPVLLQLFVIYYGLSSVVFLPAFLAALIGLGLNYGAYRARFIAARLKRCRAASSKRRVFLASPSSRSSG